ncbi:hypothetical protein HPB50_016805 [Hyalomma asiaticum]|uniref:Uncharacterized protein n=1 Tax=Hyalomma asiaticum TaxID=266040 RepID=A0ACB7SEK6_HYAAI|nr:hypothetical protein HPB50_016805 [Hyalomma asiaticum]
MKYTLYDDAQVRTRNVGARAVKLILRLGTTSRRPQSGLSLRLGLGGDNTNAQDADDVDGRAATTFLDDAKLRRDVESLDELALKLEDLAAILRDALLRASAHSPSHAEQRAQGTHYIVRFQLPIVAIVQILWVGMLATFDGVVTEETSPGYRYLVHAIMVALQVVNILHVGLASCK